MILLYLLTAALLLILTASTLIASRCLNMILYPEHFDEEDQRKKESDHGFSEDLTAYDTQWDRTPFALRSNGAVLQGEVIRNPRPSEGPQKAAIICHGHTVNRIPCIKYARMFMDLGWNCIIFDERSFGHSTGGYCTLGYKEQWDVCAMMQYARTIFGNDCRIALHGESMGAATVLMLLDKERPDLVVADCPFDDTLEFVKFTLRTSFHLPSFPIIPLSVRMANVKYGYDMKAASPIHSVKQSNVPILFMHGDADTLIPCDCSDRMYHASGNPNSELHLFSGSEHAHSVIDHPVDYDCILKAFVEKVCP